MCEWGDTVTMIMWRYSRKRYEFRDIDRCLALVVRSLNEAGLVTVASCCGHGKQPGSIVLRDGREIRIFAQYEDARRVDKMFPPINEQRKEGP